MDIKEYISSGILESYALGALSKAEEEEVNDMLQKHPELRQELREIEYSIEAYFRKYHRKPPPGLKGRIFSLVPIESKLSHSPEKKQQVSSTQIRSLYPMLTLAASFLLLLSFGLNIYYYGELNEAESQLEIAELENRRLAMEVKEIVTEKEKYTQELDILRDTAFNRIALKGIPQKSESSNAFVYWNPNSGKAFLQIGELPAPPEGMQYQLWAIVEGKPVDLGIFQHSGYSPGLQEMKLALSAGAFAVTLEKAGGSLSPTLEEMYLLGTV